MSAAAFTPTLVPRDDDAGLEIEPHIVIIFGIHRLPLSVESFVADSAGEAIHFARVLAARCPESYGYEMWFHGEKLAAYFSHTALAQNGHTHLAPTLRPPRVLR